MNILFVDQYNQPGGAQHCLLDLLPAVLAKGWGAVAMLPGEGELGESIRGMGVEVLPVSSGSYSSGHKTATDLVRFIETVPVAVREIRHCRIHRKIDLIYVNGPRLLPAAAMARGAARLLFHCHNYLAQRYLKWLTAIPLRMAHADVVVTSRYVARPLQHWIPPGRLHLVYNGVEGPAERVRTPAPRLRIGIVGRIAPEKGQSAFLRMTRILHRDLPQCEFVVCGAHLFSDGQYERQIRKMAEGLPVQFTGWRDDVLSVLCGLDLLVVPSDRIDATPRIIPQAFAAGTPVVAFANDGFRELMDDGRTGFLVVERTPEALAAKVREVLNANCLEHIADQARTEWQTRFSLDSYRRNILRILEPAA